MTTEKKNRVLSDPGTAPGAESIADRREREGLRKAAERRAASASIERLRIDDKVIDEMVAGLRDVIRLPDPVGEIVKIWRRPNGLLVGRMRIPIGVICIIYESRPNVTVDAFSLCFKSGNGVILKGGKEAFTRTRRCSASSERHLCVKVCARTWYSLSRRAIGRTL